MLRVTHCTDKIEVRFDHKICRPPEIKSLTGIYVNEDRRCSLATVSLNNNIVGRGMAVCHPKDNFCRAIGRKKALAHGLHSLSKILRTEVWIAYKAACSF